jgi:AcrR family transcriptional regulator
MDPRQSREEAGRETKERILRTFTEMVADEGYHATAIGDVAQAPGISEGAVLHHFGTKDGLLVATAARARTLVPPGPRLRPTRPRRARSPERARVLAEARAERIPHVRLGRYVRFDAGELHAWWLSRRRGPWRSHGSAAETARAGATAAPQAEHAA